MNPDLYFVVGLVISILALPAIFSALSDRHAPRAAAIMVMIGGGLIALAISQRPGAYTIAGVPDVFVRVLGGLLN